MTHDDPLAQALIRGERRALSRAITLAESGRADHRIRAAALVETVARQGRQALRIGLSGPPGVGKSTFIEAFGLARAEAGQRVAVLAVDPSSTRSGGSILGDKTRMERLSRHPNAFIRPSPSGAELGGVARRTREAVALCEAAGYDLVLIETVGVGQSETLVAGMADIFVLLIAPGGGDELQGVKRGIMEIADLILVTKADGDLSATAQRTAADYAGALRLLRRRPEDPQDYPAVLTVSAQDGAGLDAAWDRMRHLARWRRDHGHWQRRRSAQAEEWFWAELRQGLLDRLREDPALRDQSDRLSHEVAAGRRAPLAAAAQVLAALARDADRDAARSGAPDAARDGDGKGGDESLDALARRG